MTNYHKIIGVISVAVWAGLCSCTADRDSFPRALSLKNAMAITFTEGHTAAKAPLPVDSMLWDVFPVLEADCRSLSGTPSLAGREWLIGLQYFQEHGWLPTFVTSGRKTTLPEKVYASFRGVPLYQLETGLYAALHKGILVLGRLPILVEDAIRELDGGQANFAQDSSFRKCWGQRGSAQTRLFIRPSEMGRAGIHWPPYFLSGYEWLELNVEIEDRQWRLSGRALPEEEERDRLSGAMSLSFPGDLMLPDHLVAFSGLTAQAPMLAPVYQPYFTPWWPGELLIFQLEGLPEPVFAFKAPDVGLAQRHLQKLGDQQGILSEEEYQTFTLRRLLDDQLLAPWQPEGVRNPYCVPLGQYLLFSASRTALTLCIDYHLTGRPSAFTPRLFEEISSRTNGLHWWRTGAFTDVTLPALPQELSWVLEGEGAAAHIRGWGDRNGLRKEEMRFLWKYAAAAGIVRGPAVLPDPMGRPQAYLLQDETERLHLIDADGRLIWERKLPDRVISAFLPAAVDRRVYFFFNTRSTIYAIDQQGEALPAFPVDLTVPACAGLQVVDFDGNGRPVLFVPTVDGAVYGYDLQGRLLPGWNPNRDTLPLRFPLVHLQENYRDLLVGVNAADSLLLWTRAGEPAHVGWSLDTTVLSPPAVLAESPQRAIVVDVTGRGSAVNIAGKRTDLRLAVGPNQDVRWRPADVDGDGRSEHILSSGRGLAVSRARGARMESVFSYRFPEPPDTVFVVSAGSGRPSRIGALDRQRRQLFLLDGRGRLLPGFPVAATTPAVLSGHAGGDLTLSVGLGGELMTYVLSGGLME